MTPRGSLQPWRLGAVIVFFLGWMFALGGRTAYVQVVEHDRYREQALEEHWGKKETPAPRGAIRDSDGHPLAMTVYTYSVLLDSNVELTSIQVDDLASRLAPLLQMKPQDIAAAYNRKEKAPVAIKENLAFDLGQRIASLDLPAVQLVQKAKRAYPEGNLAVHVLGFVGKDQRGLAGLENDYNAELAGRPGVLMYERDTAGREIPLGIRRDDPPIDGSDLVLTIDRGIQRIVERELAAAVQRHRASGGEIIVMDPNTGGILALANQPTFDLRNLDLSQANQQMERFRNRSITDVYEPGSTFKLITMSAALQEGKVTPETTMNDTGLVVKYGWPIRNWNFQGPGISDMTTVMINSSNVGMVWVGDQLGPDLFCRYLDLFGFTQPTGIDMDGEVTGIVRTPADDHWSPLDFAVNSFGQALSVTPIQLITAVSAIVNGGTLMRPHVVREVVGPEGTREMQPVVVRRVLSEKVAAQVRKMMYEVVEHGHAPVSQMPSYYGGGKTGTAELPGATGYTELTVPSFVGFGPADDPKFVILIKIDVPRDTPWGGEVASPMFSSLGEQILTYMRVPPGKTDNVVMVDVTR